MKHQMNENLEISFKRKRGGVERGNEFHKEKEKATDLLLNPSAATTEQKEEERSC